VTGRRRNRCVGCLLLATIAVGCTSSPATREGTGAKEAVEGYYQAIVQRDWPRAYAALHADSRARCGPERFALLAENYRHALGFEPQKVHVRSCEEQGAKATAHFALIGRGASGQRRYKDAVVLRQSEGGWGVVLPQDFGQRLR
jgi:hypothetical protein